jgi:hypothetical protein
MAFRRGDDTDSAMLGAMLIADGLHCLRTVRALAAGFGVKDG